MICQEEKLYKKTSQWRQGGFGWKAYFYCTRNSTGTNELASKFNRRFTSKLAIHKLNISFHVQLHEKKWSTRYRFLFIRQRCKEIQREPIQLDLFIPQTHGYQYTVLVTNKTIAMRKVLRFHHGRGVQEKVFGELKSQSQMDYIAVRRLCGNQLYLMTAILAHNLTRELQMKTESKTRGTTERRNPVWHFEQLATLRHRILQRAGRFTRPKGKLTLTITENPALRRDLMHFLDALKEAA